MSQEKKMKQTWLDVDYCDSCGVAIKEGQEIYLDAEAEHSGIIPAYCPKCAERICGDQKA